MMKKDLLDKQALEYHRSNPPGKLAIQATKPLNTQHDLSLAYSPGVAAPCELIKQDNAYAREFTGRNNLVGVVTNGSSVLGLGNIGPLASKPVMEGKAVLFKRFSNINVFDIEIDETDVDKFCDIVAALEPTFGGINLEDIKAPECFEIERILNERMNIPVFHDDQHGTAITASAALINALYLTEKKIEDINIVCNGAGSAGLACLDMFVCLGAQKKNITLCDSKGVIYKGRTEGMNPYKEAYAQAHKTRTLEEAFVDADVFLGVSRPNLVTKKMMLSMAKQPIIFAMANPEPEILPEEAKAIRPDAICATGRSDYPNQVNNVLCFPFLFRGALDVGAIAINQEMKIACVHAIANLAKRETEDSVQKAYAGEDLRFGAEMLIPKPFDPRLMTSIPPAIAESAMKSGVATRPISDMNAYRHQLESMVHRSTGVMQPIFAAAHNEPKRVAFADAEDYRVLSAVQMAVDEGFVKPILVGRRRVLEIFSKRANLRLDLQNDVEIVDPEDDPRFREYHSLYHHLMARKGISINQSKLIVRTDTTVISALMLKRLECDAVICGLSGTVRDNLRHIKNLIGTQDDIKNVVGVHGVLINGRSVFLADTVYYDNPTAEELVEIIKMSAQVVKCFGLEPRIALLSHSNFGSSYLPCARKMNKALKLAMAQMPDYKIDGEMQADAALDEYARRNFINDVKFEGAANLLIMPNIDASSIAYRLLKSASEGFTIGPILTGTAQPIHLMNSTTSVRSIYNMIAYAVAEAQKTTHLPF